MNVNRRPWPLVVALAALLTAAACTQFEARTVDEGPVADTGARDTPPPPAPAPLDVLWVLNNTGAMAPALRDFAPELARTLGRLVFDDGVDVRFAVTTTNVCPADKATAVRGAFAYRPAPADRAEAGLVERLRLPCSTDDDCRMREDLPDADRWRCRPLVSSSQPLYVCDAPGGDDAWDSPEHALFVVNSYCEYACDPLGDPAACAHVFGLPAGCADVCANGACSVSACMTSTGLESPDTGKSAPCSRVCAEGWDCLRTCTEYLDDADRCATVCASKDCLAACRGTAFPGSDFACTLVCADAPACEDRCIAEFGRTGHLCLPQAGGNTGGRCMDLPDTAACPARDEGPTVLDLAVTDTWLARWKAGTWAGLPAWAGRDDAEVRRAVFELLAQCMIDLDSDTSSCGAQDQGLTAAWLALDPAGENADQARAFVRTDARLAVGFFSREEDCSSATPLPTDSIPRCGCLRDQNGCVGDGVCDPAPCPKAGSGSPECSLIPPQYVSILLRELKPDPSDVAVAAFSGDAIAGTPTTPTDDLDAARKRFRQCACAGTAQKSQQFYVCSSGVGTAELGSRYAAAVQAVAKTASRGPAIIENFCQPYGPALDRVHAALAPWATRP